MNVLSLFDGISSGMLALEKANIDVKNYYASEVCPIAMKVSKNNYPNIRQLGDILKLNKSELLQLGEIDLLIGGSPCQGFSRSGKQLNFKDPRSALFFEFVRVLETVKPKYFLLENVQMKQEWQDIITSYLGVEPIAINSKLVSAQLRSRLYWTNIPGVEKPKDKEIELSSILTNGYTNRKKSRALLEGDSRPLITPHKMFHRYYSTGFTTLVFKDKKHYNRCVEHYKTHFEGMSASDIDKYLEKNPLDLSVYDGVRYFNQIEMERLQTVPEGYTDGLTRNQTASVLGNGWTIDVIAHIFSYIKD